MSYKSLWDFGRSAEAKYGAHSIGEYPTKIMPQIASILVERFTEEGDTILDPYCGGGTFAVEAKMHGRNSINYDINPSAVELGKKKIEWLTQENMLSVVEELISKRNKDLENSKRKYEKVKIKKEIKKLKKRKEKISDGNSIYNNSTHTFEIKDSREMNLSNPVDAVITDIPYASMIKYTDQDNDLSTIEDYPRFLDGLSKGLENAWEALKETKYFIIFCADYRVGAARRIYPVHSDVIQIMRGLEAFLFDLYIWRYYRSGGFRPFGRPPYQAMNIHTYILTFYKARGDEKFLGKENKPVRYRKRLIEKLEEQKSAENAG